jgi:hypothetical protein
MNFFLLKYFSSDKSLENSNISSNIPSTTSSWVDTTSSGNVHKFNPIKEEFVYKPLFKHSPSLNSDRYLYHQNVEDILNSDFFDDSYYDKIKYFTFSNYEIIKYFTFSNYEIIKDFTFSSYEIIKNAFSYDNFFYHYDHIYRNLFNLDPYTIFI